MDTDKTSLGGRLVTSIPLKEIWNAKRRLDSKRIRPAGREAIKTMLRATTIQFVVADCGLPLKWVPPEDCFTFWKQEVQAHLVEPDISEQGFRLEDYAGEYCYIGSEWSGPTPVVLLEMFH